MTVQDFTPLETSAVAEGFQRWVQRAQVEALAGGCCENGSQINPTQQEKIWITGSALCAALGIAWTPLAGAICEVLVPFLLDLSPICSQCPPAPVAPNWDNVWTNGMLPASKDFIDWVVATFISQNWNTWCQCIGGVGCGSTVISEAISGTSWNVQINSSNRYPLVGDPTTMTFPWTYTTDNTSGSITIQIQFLNPAGSGVGGSINIVSGKANASGTFVNSSLHTYLGLGATQYRFQALAPTGGTGAWHTTLGGTATFSGCSNPIDGYIPPTVIAPPSNIPAPPPLPTGCTTDQICQKVTYIEQELDNIARMLWNTIVPPHSWNEGASHTGLTGNNSFTLFANTRAIKAIVTTLPNRSGSIIGSPTRIFDVGWLTAAGAEGPYQTWTLDFQQQVFVLPPVSNTLYYSIPPDVRVTVIELVAGP